MYTHTYIHTYIHMCITSPREAKPDALFEQLNVRGVEALRSYTSSRIMI